MYIGWYCQRVKTGRQGSREGKVVWTKYRMENTKEQGLNNNLPSQCAIVSWRSRRVYSAKLCPAARVKYDTCTLNKPGRKLSDALMKLNMAHLIMPVDHDSLASVTYTYCNLEAAASNILQAESRTKNSAADVAEPVATRAGED